MVVDEVSRRLLVCGSVYQGACQRRELEDIAVSDDLVLLPVAANDETSSTVAFVGPARYMGYPSRVLYVATTNSRLGPYRDMVPAICSPTIAPSISGRRRIHITTGSHLCFGCRYDSYVETTLQCLGPDGRDYNLLQDAHIVRAEPADMLVGVFAASRDHTMHSSGRSAVCVFSLADIEQRFTENIHLCYNGSVPSRDMDYIAGSIQDCPEPGYVKPFFPTCFRHSEVPPACPKSLNPIFKGTVILLAGNYSVCLLTNFVPSDELLSAPKSACGFGIEIPVPSAAAETIHRPHENLVYSQPERNGPNSFIVPDRFTIGLKDNLNGHRSYRRSLTDCLRHLKGGNIFNFCGESLKLNGSLPPHFDPGHHVRESDAVFSGGHHHLPPHSGLHRHQKRTAEKGKSTSLVIYLN
ncbi:hypothetical protein CEXT_9691 [Caerostris extrusa]|uniref:Sema domain-containing protein n=1 Tax=Caerostris extrusa TaxID=172846 RepID=A0AAV4TMD4_CAEEX|nr:hypothetical protein CEXT_9691 [Caerostris extrusa]